MTKKEKIEELDSTYISFINEECSECHRVFTDIRQIWVDTESDLYFCKRCSKEKGLRVVKCRGYDER